MVLGFYFSTDRREVLLIHKNRGPHGMAGRVNGIGGKIEPSDLDPAAAMRREFEEEAGKTVEDWELVCSFQHLQDALVHVYRAFGDLDDCRSLTDETVLRLPVGEAMALPSLWNNVAWLVHMALEDWVIDGTVRVLMPDRNLTRLQCQS